MMVGSPEVQGCGAPALRSYRFLVVVFVVVVFLVVVFARVSTVTGADVVAGGAAGIAIVESIVVVVVVLVDGVPTSPPAVFSADFSLHAPTATMQTNAVMAVRALLRIAFSE